MRLAVRKTGLPQVLCVGPQDRHLLPGQSGTQHQLVEPVDLHLALPDGSDRVGEPGGDDLAFGLRCVDSGLVRRDLELVDPHRHAVAAYDIERLLFQHHHAGGLQHRQQLTERRRAAGQIPGELRGAVLVGGRLGVVQHEFDAVVLQLIDDADGGDGLDRRERLLVHLGERHRIVLGLGPGDGARRDGADQPVAPRPGRLGQQALNPRLVRRGGVDTRRAGGLTQAHGEMHDSPWRFTDARGVLDAFATELANQDVLHRQPDVGGVPVTRQVHQARHEVGQLVGTQEQQRTPARTQVDDGLAHVHQVARGQREQFGPRHGLDDVEHQLAGPARVPVGQRQCLVDPARDQRYLKHIRVARGDGELSDEAVFAGGPVRARALADHHDVRVGAVAQVAGHGGLRDRQQFVVARQRWQHVGA